MKKLAIVCLTLAIALASSCEKISTEFGKMKIKVTDRTLNSITLDVSVELPDDAPGYNVECYIATKDPMQLYLDNEIMNDQPSDENPYWVHTYFTSGLPGTHTYSITLEELEPWDDYKVRVFVQAPNGLKTWSELATVSTILPDKPEVLISKIDVYATSIKVTYEIEDTGARILEEGFCISDKGEDFEKQISGLTKYKNGETVTGLEMDTEYFIMAYAKTVSGWSWSDKTNAKTKKYVDLSAEETANCYIVSSASRYAFKACRATESTPLGGSKAEVYWETVNTGTKPEVGTVISDVFYYKDSGLIEFEATGTPGNALIALYDENNVIIWSWHIWSTDQPKDQVYSNNAGTMMDRNLGALSASKEGTLSWGLIYQWGRKDPYLSSLEEKTVYGYCGKTFQEVRGKQKYEYSIANPAARIYCKGDWCSDVAAKGRWSATNKTVNDPCPPGYHIPSSTVWSTNLKDNAFTISNSSEWADGYDFATGSCKFGTNDTSIWYPVTGMIMESGDDLIRLDLGYYWSEATDDNYAGTLLMMSRSSISLATNTNDALARSVAVRCQKN